ncbi:MAG: hypothetical protein AUJ98_05515 [Bacteroidetes bacterium CG2_30_33_31]|nr:MAG: hypothetical protein AUJ98_05515 [Bacteroidetes bacterium CG2_30_33_31]
MAQQDSLQQKERFLKNLSFLAMYQAGYVFATNEFLRGVNVESEKVNSIQAISLKVSKQTTGDNDWEQMYNYPNWGLGFYIADFDNSKEIGNPFAFYAFINAPFVRKEKLTFNWELGIGATFNWKSYNPVTNKYNISIGASNSFYIDAGLNINYPLTERINFIGGFSLSHFSNGGIKKPNYGINSIAPKISLQYNLYDKLNFKERQLPKKFKQNEFAFSVFAGVKNVIFDSVNIDILEKYEGVFFTVAGLNAAVNKQVSHKSKIGFGFSLSYDGSINAQIAIDKNELTPLKTPFKDKFQISIFPSYELVVDKLSLIIQPSFYIYRLKMITNTPIFYQRVGLKYHFNNNIFMGLNLRAYDFHVSDFIEWNVGYRILWKK